MPPFHRMVAPQLIRQLPAQLPVRLPVLQQDLGLVVVSHWSAQLLAPNDDLLHAVQFQPLSLVVRFHAARFYAARHLVSISQQLKM